MFLFRSKIARGFLIAGMFIPCLLNGFFYLKLLRTEQVPDWLLMSLWPAVGFYFSAGYGGVGAAILGFVISVLANGVVYWLVGAFISLLHHLLSVRGAKGAVQS